MDERNGSTNRQAAESGEDNSGAAFDGEWLDSFEDLAALRDALRRRCAAGELDIENVRDLEVLRRWNDALAGLTADALVRFVHETFVGMDLMTTEEAELLLTGLRLFRRREWAALSPHVRAQLERHERLTDGIVVGFRARLEKALAIMEGNGDLSLEHELLKTKSDRNALIEIRGVIDFMNEVSVNDPLLRLRLRDVVRAAGGNTVLLDEAIRDHAIPTNRIASLICQAVRGILATIVNLETSNLKARQPRLYESRKQRAIYALGGHLRRARELGCAAVVRSVIIERLRLHPGVFEAYFGTRYPFNSR